VLSSKAVTPEEQLDESGDTRDSGVRVEGSSGLRILSTSRKRKRSRAHDESRRRKLRGLLSDQRIAQSPLEVQKGSRGQISHGRECRSCESTGVTRTRSGTCVSRRAGENAGAELLGAGVEAGRKSTEEFLEVLDCGSDGVLNFTQSNGVVNRDTRV
jgi:hypothetical protein